ncbi:branched-subunit amino acid aminotransferase/4-amino-4-deoxychorismate lyase [Aurantimicrobium minutum]|uniref:aminotransferase class IV n=1 Tax=Aurantimicrobium minutum TaxID=708131 RepID=UPI0024768CD5|nr:aminotransferase class IV [Aurantimicrobium minutum]MDH6533142.1 branched-subunit amino acid aminotransferase/4-amino-4-deoxychorismate lyase [Aurantimicrobium minutum]
MDVLRYRWNGSELVDISGAPMIPLYVADSFLLRAGQVAGFARHLDRFATSATTQGLVRPVDTFLDAVTVTLPKTGVYFPRIDLTERGELELWVRPAPALKEHIVLATATCDPRTEPALKGPDIPALTELRKLAQAQGADDAVIVDAQGRVIDGSTTCLLWFDGDTAVIPPAEAIRVDSVTVALVSELLKAEGTSLTERWATPQDLSNREIYALNALHGVRAVTQWREGPLVALNPTRFAALRESYESQFENISEA